MFLPDTCRTVTLYVNPGSKLNNFTRYRVQPKPVCHDLKKATLVIRKAKELRVRITGRTDAAQGEPQSCAGQLWVDYWVTGRTVRHERS